MSDVHIGHMDNIKLSKASKYMANFKTAGIFYGGDWFDEPNDELFQLKSVIRGILAKQGTNQ
jgi:hypothetical protein